MTGIIANYGGARNMNSSEALSKFSIWKQRNTPLLVTVIVGGQTTEILHVRLYSMDEELSLVGTVGSVPHSFKDFDVEGSGEEV